MRTLSILGREVLRFGKVPPGATRITVPADSPMTGILAGFRKANSWGYEAETNNEARLAAYTGYVHTCVSTRAMRDAKARYLLHDARDPKTPIPEERLPIPYQFFRRPNPVFSEYQLSMLVRVWLMLCGKAPLLKLRNGAGAPAGQWPLLPSRVRAFYDATDLVRYEYTDNAGQKIPIPGRDLIYIRKPHPTKPFDGIGDLEGAGLFHDTDQLLWSFQRELFDKGPFSTWILQYPVDVQFPEGGEQIIADSFAQIVGDRSRTQFPVVLGQGAEAKSFPVTNKGLEVPTINEEIKERIRCAFGVSKAIMGEVDMGSRANVEGAEVGFAQRSKADNQLISDAYQHGVLGEWDLRLIGAHEDLAPEDREYKLRENIAMKAGGAITVNEWRGAAGREPIEGGDELDAALPAAPEGGEDDPPTALAEPTADVQAQALNGLQVESLTGIIDKVAAGAMSKPTAAALISIAFPTVTAEQISGLLDGIVVREPEPAPVTPEPPPPPPAKKPDPDPATGLSLEAAPDPKQVRLAKSRAFVAWQSKHEARLLAALQPILAAERDAIIARIEKHVPKALTKIVACRDKKDARQVLADAPEIKAITDMEQFAAEYKKLTPNLVTIYTEAGKTAAGQHGVSFVVDARGIKRIGNHLERSTDSILKTTAEQIRSALEEGFLEGEGVGELSNRIRELYDGISAGRAEVIARTETVAPANDGAMQGYAQAGVDKEWIATADEATRDTHAALDGTVIAVDAEFKVGKDHMLYPGGGSEPEENINCRCTIGGVAPKDDGE